MEPSGLNIFDGALYINLAIRPDRLFEIQSEISSVGLTKAQRIEAVYDELNGTKGCVLSHIKALNRALEKGWRSVLILEDDCTFTEDLLTINTTIHEFLSHFKDDWDVFFLGTFPVSTEPSTHDHFLRVRFSMRAHAYVVNGPYIERLRDHYMQTYDSLKDDLFFHFSLQKSLDLQWVALQDVDLWYVGKRPVASQRASFSDIEKCDKNNR